MTTAPQPTPTELAGLLRRALDLHQRGQLSEAEALYAAVLASQPDNFDALHLYGALKHQRGEHAQALDLIGKALELNDGSAAAHGNYGKVLAALGRHEEAVASYGRSLALAPDLVNALLGHGNTLSTLGRFAEALTSYDRLAKLVPNSPEVMNNRGNALWALRRPAEALASYDAALALAPDDAATHNNRGNALLDLNRAAEALESFDRALTRYPNYMQALLNRGNALQSLGRNDEAMASFERALALDPNFADAHWNKGLLHLLLGDFARGWPGYEYRQLRSGAPVRHFKEPQWRGEDLHDKTILLHAEQGFGDSIQFLRYLPMVAARGAKIILELPDALMPLVAPNDRVIALINRDQPRPPYDLQCPLLSLPAAFGTTLATIPPPGDVLRVPAERLEQWRTRLPPQSTPRVGIVWSGKPTHGNDHNRSIALAQLTPLLQTPGIDFVSLQRENRAGDAAVVAKFPILRLEEQLADFADTAAAIMQLDLVIAVDTAVAHLAGALSKPVWILLPKAPDWRWLLDRDDSPWYPTARLFRQPKIGDWGSVVARLQNELGAAF